MSWTYASIVDMIARMERRAHRGFAVSARTAPLVIEALGHYAREHFGIRPRGYRIDVWDASGDRIELHYADMADLYAARDAYQRAIEQNPRNLVTLRQGIRVVAASDRPVP